MPLVAPIEPAAPLLKLQLNPVLLVAVVAYVVVVVPFVSWQDGSLPADIVIAVGVPTVGVIFTVRDTWADGPLHPRAITCMSTVPEKPSDQVRIPVVRPMLPAEGLLTFEIHRLDFAY